MYESMAAKFLVNLMHKQQMPLPSVVLVTSKKQETKAFATTTT